MLSMESVGRASIELVKQVRSTPYERRKEGRKEGRKGSKEGVYREYLVVSSPLDFFARTLSR
jgi:hypothetical protein